MKMEPETSDDFESNGVTLELDDMDILMINARVYRSISARPIIPVDCEEIRPDIEVARQKLTRMRPLSNKKQFCVFCKNNREDFSVYATHTVRDDKGDVSCPILQKYVCPVCAATGLRAHTIKYCPYNNGSVSTVCSILKTARDCSGRRRHDKR